MRKTAMAVAAALVVAGTASVAVPQASAVSYVIDSGTATSDPTFATLDALKTAHGTLANGDSIEFKNDDSTLASSFIIADNATLTLSGTATIGAANNTTSFINDSTKTFTLVAADSSTITFSGLGGGIDIKCRAITLGTTNSTGTLIFNNNNTGTEIVGVTTRPSSGGVNYASSTSIDFSSTAAIRANDSDVVGITIAGGVNKFNAKSSIVSYNIAINDGTNTFDNGQVLATYFTISGGTNTFKNRTDANNLCDGAAVQTSGLTITGGVNKFESNQGLYTVTAYSPISITGGTNTFENNKVSNLGGAIWTQSDVTLRATNGDMLFRGNTDGTGATLKANAIHMTNYYSNSTLAIAAESGKKIEFFDPITSNASKPTLTIKINDQSTDTGTVIFDGSYWQAAPQSKTVAANPEYFTTKLYGNANVGYGTLEIKNGVIFDVSGNVTVDSTGKLEVNSGGEVVVNAGKTLTTGIYEDASNVWTSNVTTSGGGTITFKNGSMWYVKESSAFLGGELAGTIDATGDVDAALVEGNKRNTLYEFLYDSTNKKLTTEVKPKADVNDTTVNAPVMFQANAMGTAASGRVQQRFGLQVRGDGVYRGQECEPCAPCRSSIGPIGRISPMGPISVWANYIGRSTELVSSSTIDGLAGTAKIVSNGVQVGADKMIGRRTVVGAMFSYEHARDTLGASRMLGDNYSFALYGAQQFRSGFDCLALVGYGHQQYDSRRYDVGALAMRTANFSGNTFEMTLETGRKIRLDKNLWLRPVVAFDVYNNDVANFIEAGGLAFGAMSLTQAFVRVGSDFVVRQNRLTMNSGVYYSHQMSAHGNVVRTTVDGGGGAVNVWGSDLGRNKLTFNVGGDYKLGAKTNAFGGYSGDYFADRAGKPWGHTGFAGVRWAW
ncbi:MAG: autotransporter domain-containing protein [Thermoguttaceae bacterium]